MVIGRDLRREIKNRENFVRTDFRKIRTRKNFPLYGISYAGVHHEIHMYKVVIGPAGRAIRLGKGQGQC